MSDRRSLTETESTALPTPFRHLTATILAAWAIGVATAIVNFAWLAYSGDRAIVRDTALMWLSRYGVEMTGHSLLDHLPLILDREMHLRSLGGALLFAGTTVAANAALLLFVAIPVGAVGAALLATRAGRTPTGRALLSGFTVVALWVAPLVFLVHTVLHRLSPSVACSIGAAAAVLLAVIRIAVRRRVIRTAVRSLLVAGMAIVVVAAVVPVARGLTRGSADVRPSAAPGSPNVLLISIDSLRADRLHCYGNPHETSPTLDQLAKEGARFETVIAPTSWTLPSHVSLFTGMPPSEHGVNFSNRRLGDDATTLPEILHRHGYETAGFVSSVYLERRYGFDQGFDHFDDYSIPKASGTLERLGSSSAKIVSLVVRWLERRNDAADRPFFVFLHMWDVHLDYDPPPPYDKMFDPDYAGPIHMASMRDKRIRPGMSQRDLQHVKALYDGEIRNVDTQIGRLIAYLRDRGVLDRTIVAVTADHGDEWFEHGRFSHHQTLYDEVVRVPLIIRDPGEVPAATVVHSQVRLMDVAPTILSLAGVRYAPFVETARRGLARNLTPLFGGDDRLPPVIAYGNLENRLVSAQTLKAKLIVNLVTGMEEIYDLASDPGETKNLASSLPADYPLRVALRKWRARWRDTAGFAEKTKLSGEDKARLRALGYLK